MSTHSTPRISRGDAFRLGRLDAHEQAALLRSGELSASELIEAAIVRIECLDPALNAVSYRAFEAARAKAAAPRSSGALAGIPYLLKEGLDYPGMPSRCASRSKLASPNMQLGHDYARVLDEAGLIALGKTSTPEFALLPTTEPLLYGPTRNPWALDRSPGGSSGGAAAAVASGMVPLAHASDGGGSIRIPASCCGVFGLKPGRGANVRARAHHFIEDMLVSDTLLSRSVRDVAWATSLASGGARVGSFEPHASERRLRIGVVVNNLHGDAPHPEVARVLSEAANLCSRLGHHVEATVLPIDGPAVAAAFRTIWAYVARDIVENCRAALTSTPLEEVLEPWTLDLARSIEEIGIAEIENVFEQVPRAADGLRTFFETCDVILSPVLKEGPLPIGRLAPTRPFEALSQQMFDYVSYTPLHNLAGVPSMSVPLYPSREGLPIGSMFSAARGAEARLLQLAFELERACSWADRWPEHSVAAAPES